MLAEERFTKILSILEEEGTVEVSRLMEALGTSESTIRRDLNTLDARGMLVKVHGGAVSKNNQYQTRDDEVDLRKERNVAEKTRIAQYAANLIGDDDVVYLDAGTTTELMIQSAINRKALYVTNAVGHAKKLSVLGCRVYLLGGEFKGTTDAIVGEEAVVSLEKYNFTKGFFGANGVTKEQGFTTPEPKEALIKQKAMAHSKEAFVLVDSSKFGEISSVTFGQMDRARIITDIVPKAFGDCDNIKEVDA
ncbi:MAG: DeoR/GlpR family DNA-binding transcription regulator [Lachnospiraceae bacterium]|nr:DeoR/GlpR family DNA-binding transcription regulator [Lachnospiraceae bacterium]